MIAVLVLMLCLSFPPLEGPVIAGFAPSSGYDGHWGVDIAAPYGSTVRAPDAGEVTFAGPVAGMRSVTILTDEGLRISLSYLSSIDVSTGQRLEAGTVVGASGLAHGEPALHVSTRLGETYVDPAPYLRCGSGTIRLLLDR